MKAFFGNRVVVLGTCLVALGASCGPAGAPAPKTAPGGASPSASSAAPAGDAPSSSAGAMPPMLLLPGAPTGNAAPTPPHPPTGPQPACKVDEDCWSWTCCPPTLPTQCVHYSLAQKCSIVEVNCTQGDTPLRCACVASECAGVPKG